MSPKKIKRYCDRYYGDVNKSPFNAHKKIRGSEREVFKNIKFYVKMLKKIMRNKNAFSKDIIKHENCSMEYF